MINPQYLGFTDKIDWLLKQYWQFNGRLGSLEQSGGSGSGDALQSLPLSQFASTTSAQLASVISDATGLGVAMFNTSPTILGVINTSGAAGLVIGQAGSKLGFFNTAAITQPSGDILSALSLLGLVSSPTISTISLVPTHADDTAASLAGLTTGMLYKTTTLGSTYLKIVP